MKEYEVPVLYMMSGTVTVKADSREEAALMAEDEPLPLDGSYVFGSFEVNECFFEDNEDEDE